MRIALGTVKSAYQNLPRYLLRIERPKRSERVRIIGRLYQGYVGVLWITRYFEVNIWVYKPVKN